MKVVILCGGLGTRISDVAGDIPKPMILIGPYPIVWHIMKYYSSFGHSDFVLCLGYKNQAVKEFFLNYEAHTKDFTISLGHQKGIEFHSSLNETNWKVTLADTGLNSMTGARIKRIKNDNKEVMLNRMELAKGCSWDSRFNQLDNHINNMYKNCE